jgi:hypothetical protein
MARRREHLSAYLRICISGRQQNHKKSRKIKKESLDTVQKNVPAGSNAYMRIYYFLKKSQPKGHGATSDGGYDTLRAC